MGLTVSGLFIYPIKSCRGVAVPSLEVDLLRGVRHDRTWMLVDTEGNGLTQRKHPRMAAIEARVEGPRLIVDAPGMPTADIDYVSWTGVGQDRNVRVHDHWTHGLDHGDGAANWFSAALGTRCRLIGSPRGLVRHAPQGNAWLSYADAYPLLLISQASLDDLNARLAEAVPMDRFRPNIVVSGTEPYAEDAWSDFTIADTQFLAKTRCTRCEITMTDQMTGERAGKEPLRTLATYRRAPELGNKTVFGRNVNQVCAGVIRLGDTVTILGTNDPTPS